MHRHVRFFYSYVKSTSFILGAKISTTNEIGGNTNKIAHIFNDHFNDKAKTKVTNSDNKRVANKQNTDRRLTV